MLGKFGRTCVFIDNTNLFHAVRSKFDRKIDYIKLVDVLTNKNPNVSLRFYYNEPLIHKDDDFDAFNSFKNRKAFYYVLQQSGYIVIPCSEGDRIDLEIVYDMRTLVNNFDSFVLVSGNENYARPCIRIRQDTGIITAVVFFEEHCSKRLICSVNNRFIELGKEDIFRDAEEISGSNL